jgi:hypothetical protein
MRTIARSVSIRSIDPGFSRRGPDLEEQQCRSLSPDAVTPEAPRGRPGPSGLSMVGSRKGSGGAKGCSGTPLRSVSPRGLRALLTDLIAMPAAMSLFTQRPENDSGVRLKQSHRMERLP